MSVMNEKLRRLTRPAYLPHVTLQILVLDGPHKDLGELSANLRLAPDRGAVHQGTVCTGHLRNDISMGSAKAACKHRLTCPTPAKGLPGPRWCKELTPKTTESHWSGGQREP